MSSSAPARPPVIPAPPPDLILADDVTGACDAALPFVTADRRVVVGLRACPQVPADITAISTESRDLPEPEAAAAMAGVLARLDATSPSARRVYKKVDSQLRGPVGAELAVALRRSAAPALVAPALPRLGRVVDAGMLIVPGSQPVDVAQYLRLTVGLPVASVSASTDPGALAGRIGAAARRARVVVCDARTDVELEAIGRAAGALHPAPLLVGSSGLAGALARAASGAESPQRPRLAPADRILFVLGSLHPVVQLQLEELVARRAVHRLGLGDVLPTAGNRLPDGSVVLESIAGAFRPPDGGATARALGRAASELLEREPFDAVVCCGGAVAAAVCAELRVDGLELLRDLTPGFAVTGIRPPAGGPGLLALRSGGFGTEDDLVEAHDLLRGGAP